MATQPRQRRSPADHTGAQRDQLEKEHKEEIARRSEEMGMATAAAARMSDEVVDLTKAPVEVPAVAEAPEIVGGEDSTVVIRINTDLDDVTVGAGNNYTFKEGQQYRVPVHVAVHLEEKGFVWH